MPERRNSPQVTPNQPPTLARGEDPVPDEIGASITTSLATLIVVLLIIACLGLLTYVYGPGILGGVLNFLFVDMSNEISRYVAP